MPSILTEKEKARSCSSFFMVWVNDLNPIRKKKKRSGNNNLWLLLMVLVSLVPQNYCSHYFLFHFLSMLLFLFFFLYLSQEFLPLTTPLLILPFWASPDGEIDREKYLAQNNPRIHVKSMSTMPLR